MKLVPVCQGVFVGGAPPTIAKERNCKITRNGAGDYTVQFAGALGINVSDLDVSAWCKAGAAAPTQRVVNVAWSNANSFRLLFTDDANPPVATDDIICGFVAQEVQG